MSSRHRGVLLIGLVLLAAAVIPNLRSRTVAGTAQAVPVPGPPAVGDCVTDPIDPGWNNLGVRSVPAGTTVSTYTYPQVAISHCQVSRYGEITEVIANPTKPVVTTTGDGSGSSMDVTDSNMDTCQSAGYRYVGIATTGNSVAPLLARWYPQLFTDTAASTPSIRQQVAGQHWLACIVYLHGFTDPGLFAEQERYDSSLRNAFLTGAERNRTGLCVAGANLDQGKSGLIGCGTDHQSEIFGSGATDDHPMARTDLQRSCRQVVARLTNLQDVTAAGLTVQMLATDRYQAPITSASIPANTILSCGVTSTHYRSLAGSLLAIGSQPIPWK